MCKRAYKMQKIHTSLGAWYTRLYRNQLALTVLADVRVAAEEIERLFEQLDNHLDDLELPFKQIENEPYERISTEFFYILRQHDITDEPIDLDRYAQQQPVVAEAKPREDPASSKQPATADADALDLELQVPLKQYTRDEKLRQRVFVQRLVAVTAAMLVLTYFFIK